MPTPQLVQMRARLEGKQRRFAGGDEALLAAIRDPYLNAIHVSLLREEKLSPQKLNGEGGTLTRKLLDKGPAGLSAAERLQLASDPEAMAWLHREYWLRGEAVEV